MSMMEEVVLPLLTACALLVFFLLLPWFARAGDKRSVELRYLAQQRRQSCKVDFVEYFTARNVPREVAEGVLDYIQRLMADQGVRNYPVFPQDRLVEDYEVDLEYLNSAQLLRQCGRKWSNHPPEPEPMVTVEDFVNWMAKFPSKRSGSVETRS